MIQHQRPLSASSVYNFVDNKNDMGLLEDCIQAKPNTSANLGEIKPIISLGVFQLGFEDREIKNLKLV